MGLAILGGIAKSFKIEVPDTDKVRPMSVMLRRRIFDANQDLRLHVFIDLCAGSGAVGIEAWSRGASKVLFVETDRQVFQKTKSNIEKIKTKFQDEALERPLELSSGDCREWLKKFKTEYHYWPTSLQEKTIILLAPPYEMHHIYEDVLMFLDEDHWFRGVLWLEADEQKGPHEKWYVEKGLDSLKTYTQGTSFIKIKNYYSN